MLDNLNKSVEINLSSIGKDEMNLVEFPISLLSKKNFSKNNTIEFSDIIVGENNRMVKREWVVTGSDKYGLPLAYDNDVLLALFLIGKENNFTSRKIFFSRYQICQILGWERCGRRYKSIEDALDRLKGVSIKAKNAFWDNERKSYVTKNFGIIDDYELFDSTRTSSAQKTLQFSFANLNEHIFNSIQAGYIKNIDIKIYFSLDGLVSKRLYRYLDKKRYGKMKFEINLFTLALEHLGMSKGRPYPSQIKQVLNDAHDELIRTGFLKSVDYLPTADGMSEKVVYVFARKAEGCSENSLIDGDSVDSEKDETPERKLVNLLVASGISRMIAGQLVKDYPLQKIENQLNAIKFRKAKNPAGMLISAIQEDWALPEEYAGKVERENRQALKNQQLQQEEAEKALRRKKVESIVASMSLPEKEKLKEEALEMARKEGGSYFSGKPIPEFLLKSYMHIIIEKRAEK